MYSTAFWCLFVILLFFRRQLFESFYVGQFTSLYLCIIYFTSLTIADAGLNWSSTAFSLTEAKTLAAVAAPTAGG